MSQTDFKLSMQQRQALNLSSWAYSAQVLRSQALGTTAWLKVLFKGIILHLDLEGNQGRMNEGKMNERRPDIYL